MRAKSRGLLIAAVSCLIALNAYGQHRGLAEILRDVDPSLTAGKQWLVIIAVSRYDEWPGLKYPVPDALGLRSSLSKRYIFDEILELYDESATREGVTRLFRKLQGRVGPEDSVLILYSGHGILDSTSNQGYWILTDGGADRQARTNWLANTEVRDLIAGLKTRHVCLLSDAGFSTDLLEPGGGMEPSRADKEAVAPAYRRSSRRVLGYGTAETLPNRAEFIFELIRALEMNARPFLDAATLFRDVRKGITAARPIFGSLQQAGHQPGAGFYLFLKDKEVIAARTVPPGIVIIPKIMPKEETPPAPPPPPPPKEFGSVAVSAQLKGDVYLDGDYQGGVVPGDTLNLGGIEAGVHRVEIRYEDGATETRTLTVRKDQTETASFDRILGALVIETSLDGELYLDGKPVRRITAGEQITVEAVELGEYAAEMRYDGGGLEAQTIQVAGAEPLTVVFERAFGDFEVEVKQSGDLYLDDTFLRKVSEGSKATIEQIEVGVHRLSIRYDDGETEQKWIEVARDETRLVYFAKLGLAIPNNMILVEGGSFRMGDDGGQDWEKPAHRVTITKNYYISRYEVTTLEYCGVMNWALDRGLRGCRKGHPQRQRQETAGIDQDDLGQAEGNRAGAGPPAAGQGQGDVSGNGSYMVGRCGILQLSQHS